MFRLIVCSILLTSYISACGDPLPGKGSSSDLGLLAVPTSLSFPDQSSSEEILSLTLVNPSEEPFTITGWRLEEADEVEELFIVEQGSWVNEQVIIPPTGQMAIDIAWRPIDDLVDSAVLTILWEGGELTANISTGNRLEEMLEAGSETGGTEGGAEAGSETGGIEGGAEAGSETGGTEGGAEAGSETGGAEGGIEAGAEGGAEAGSEGGAESGTEAGESAGTEGGVEAGVMMPLVDLDGDGVDDSIDNCISTANPNQEDSDQDGAGDLCDRAPQQFNFKVRHQGLIQIGGHGVSNLFNHQSSASSGVVNGSSRLFKLKARLHP